MIELPINHYYENTDSKCLKVELPEGGVGVLVIGGMSVDGQTYSNTAELLSLSTGVWKVIASFDKKWEHLNYGFLELGGKPTIVGSFNGTDKNVMEQYDLAENTWIIKECLSCGTYSIGMSNAVNIPSSIFPSCTS